MRSRMIGTKKLLCCSTSHPHHSPPLTASADGRIIRYLSSSSICSAATDAQNGLSPPPLSTLCLPPYLCDFLSLRPNPYFFAKNRVGRLLAFLVPIISIQEILGKLTYVPFLSFYFSQCLASGASGAPGLSATPSAAAAPRSARGDATTRRPPTAAPAARGPPRTASRASPCARRSTAAGPAGPGGRRALPTAGGSAAESARRRSPGTGGGTARAGPTPTPPARTAPADCANVRRSKKLRKKRNALN